MYINLSISIYQSIYISICLSIYLSNYIYTYIHAYIPKIILRYIRVTHMYYNWEDWEISVTTVWLKLGNCCTSNGGLGQSCKTS